jgi:AhpD family alkylhydroperoxidase
MNHNEVAQEMRSAATALHKGAPATMAAFQGVMKAASKEAALSSKVKEPMAVAISIAERCEGGIIFHVQNAIRHGASREELADTI